MSIQRKTIGRELVFKGIGVHSASPCRVELCPTNEGLFFRLGSERVPVSVEALSSAEFGIRLTSGKSSVAVVEHLLSALFALGVSDCEMVVDGPECPILDGSAILYYKALKEATLSNVDGEIEPLVLGERVQWNDGDRYIIAEPAERFELDVSIDYPHPMIGKQRWCGFPLGETYPEEIAAARTFGFESDKQKLYRADLALGAGPENSLIYTCDGLYEGQSFRFIDEPVRHKVLDLMGDLSLLGAPIQAKITSFKGGHRLNVRLVEKILNSVSGLHDDVA